MSEEEIKKIAKEEFMNNVMKQMDSVLIFTYIQNLENQLQQKENIIKELNDKIEDDKMIIEGNLGCIDNLRKDYNLQKNIIKEVREKLNTQLAFTSSYQLNYQSAMSIIEEAKSILDKENK